MHHKIEILAQKWWQDKVKAEEEKNKQPAEAESKSKPANQTAAKGAPAGRGGATTGRGAPAGRGGARGAAKAGGPARGLYLKKLFITKLFQHIICKHLIQKQHKLRLNTLYDKIVIPHT